MQHIAFGKHRRLTARFSLVGALAFVVAACAGQTPQTGTGAISSAPVSGDFTLTGQSAGKITPATGFSQSAIQQLYPGRRLQTTRIADDRHTFHALSVYDQGLQTIAVIPADGGSRIKAVHGLGPNVAGPNGERIGMTFSEIGQNRGRCSVGQNLWRGMPICRARGADNVLLVFDPGPENIGSQTELPGRAILSQSRLQRIVWQPRS